MVQEITNREIREHLEADARRREQLAATLSEMNTNMRVLTRAVAEIEKTLHHGNGRQPLVTRVSLLENQVHSRKNFVVWLIPTVIAAISCIAAVAAVMNSGGANG